MRIILFLSADKFRVDPYEKRKRGRRADTSNEESYKSQRILLLAKTLDEIKALDQAEFSSDNSILHKIKDCSRGERPFDKKCLTMVKAFKLHSNVRNLANKVSSARC